MKGDSTYEALPGNRCRFDPQPLETLWIMNCTYRTSAMPTIMVGFCLGETPKNSFGKQALTRKLWLEFMESSVWYGKTIQELSWRICFIQRKKKNYELRMYIPISQGQSGSWDSSMAAMGFTIGEAPNIPTNIPPETKNGGEHQHQPKNENKNVGFASQSSASKVLIIIAIFFMQLLANGCLLFVDFDRMCTLLGDLLGKSLLFKVMGPPTVKFAEMTGVPKTWSERLDMNTCESCEYHLIFHR